MQQGSLKTSNMCDKLGTTRTANLLGTVAFRGRKDLRPAGNANIVKFSYDKATYNIAPAGTLKELVSINFVFFCSATFTTCGKYCLSQLWECSFFLQFSIVASDFDCTLSTVATIRRAWHNRQTGYDQRISNILNEVPIFVLLQILPWPPKGSIVKEKMVQERFN